MTRRLILAALALLAATGAPAAQSDLDAFMARVVERRDENWKKLQQYVLDERETLRLLGPGGAPIFGQQREYTWFIRQGFFVRSPTRANGAAIGEDERQKYEDTWIRNEQRREERRAKREGRDVESPAATEDVLRQSVEPQFVSAAYFLRFRFDPGSYALAGRETLDGRTVLRIEYYPTRLFSDDNPDPDREDSGREERERRRRERAEARGDREAEAEDRITTQMNKVSVVTLWVLPENHQVVRYTFDNVDWGFLPGRWLLRAEEARASMQMVEAFPDVWLPDAIDMHVRMMTAAGGLDARYDIRYDGYRLADVKTRIVP
ncbi:MAG: hypothetical protein Q8L86_19740 [Vicinamibacterales bacterium]|nr:hypothetical protein [Vicinamibacterales bacterium]